MAHSEAQAVHQLKASYYGALCSSSGSKNELSPGCSAAATALTLCSPNAPALRGWAESEQQAVADAEPKASPFKWWGYITELGCQLQNFLCTYFNIF